MARAKPKFKASRLYLAFHVACVLLTHTVIIVWAFTSSWAWPELLPQTFSKRGIQEIFVQQQELGSILGVSVGIALIVAVLTTIVAGLAARALVVHSFFGRELFRFATVLPFLVPFSVFAMGVQVAFIRVGLANTVPGVVLAHMIVALPYAVMIMSNVSAAAGTRLEEQAQVSGAGPLATLVHIQVPSLLPGIVSSLTMSYILSFSQYFLTLLIGGGTVKTIATVMFPYLASGDRTIASAYGFVFLAATFIVFLVFELVLNRYMAKKTEYFGG